MSAVIQQEPVRGLSTGPEITLDELQLAARNHSMPLEALHYPITPVGLHYLLTHFDIPRIDPAQWRLTIGGHVRDPITLTLEGRAWSGQGRVVRVEVSTDGGGSWADADLREDGGDFAWQSWRYPWVVVVQEGEYELCCRATDASGSVQPLTTRWNAQGMCNNEVQRITVAVGQPLVPVQPPVDGIP